MGEPITVDIWSDVACPWCYIGKHRFEAALAELGRDASAPAFEVTWHSYQLSPDLPEKVEQSHAEYLGAKLGWSPDQVAAADRRITDLGRQLGLEFDYEANRPANTNRAHQLLHMARRHGVQNEVKEALFEAYFRDGIDISDIEALVAIAGRNGIDPQETREALQQGRFADEVMADRAQAQQIGVNGVPFFVIDRRYGLSGAQDSGTFVDALRQVASRKATQQA